MPKHHGTLYLDHIGVTIQLTPSYRQDE